MPTYQYACTECGHRFEEVQSFSEDSLTHCPQCDGRLRKVFNAVSVVFKGSGFYRTDSRAGSEAAPAAAASAGSSGTDGSTTTEKSSSSGTHADAGSPSTKTPTPASSTASSS